MTRIYLDTSIYNRPFDDQSQPRIFLETQAVILILQMVEAGVVNLVSSSVLEYENSKNPYPRKRRAMEHYLQRATWHQTLNEDIRQRAQELEQSGVKTLDALHVASAEAGGCEYLLTTDKRLINRCQALTLKVMNPADFVLEISDER
jgi:predicted nucleic acid-binding protein